jgi:hypothetical protein
VERTGYKEVWIGATPPTGSRRQSRDRNILVDDIWFDTSTRTLKRCSSTSPPTWEEFSLAVNSDTLAVPAGSLSVTVTITPTDADYRPSATPTWNTTCFIPVATKLAGSFIVWFGAPPDAAQSLYWRIER